MDMPVTGDSATLMPLSDWTSRSSVLASHGTCGVRGSRAGAVSTRAGKDGSLTATGAGAVRATAKALTSVGDDDATGDPEPGARGLTAMPTCTSTTGGGMPPALSACAPGTFLRVAGPEVGESGGKTCSTVGRSSAAEAEPTAAAAAVASEGPVEALGLDGTGWLGQSGA